MKDLSMFASIVLLIGNFVLFSTCEDIKHGRFLRHSNRMSTKSKALSLPKILVYITTHMSYQHKKYLKHCWPLALRHSYLLNSSDIMLHMVAKPGEIHEPVEIVKETFKEQQKVNYHVSNNLGKQAGAIAALKDASKFGWFNDYDWVIRLNPDVIIQNDKWLLDTIKNDENAGLLYVSCHPATYPEVRGVQTDFFALKVADNLIDFNTNGSGNSEQFFSDKVKHLILNGQHRHIPDSYQPHYRHCRVDANINGPVVHFHTYKLKNDVCPAKFF